MNRIGDARSREQGMTLVEVIVALTLIGVVAAAAATFFIAGIAGVKKLQSAQVATTVANQAMDTARSVSPRGTGTDDISGLLRGRTQNEVTAVVNAAAPQDVVDLSFAGAYDPAGLAGAADDWVPLTSTDTVANTTYHVTTLIGTCYLPTAASTGSQDCGITSGSATTPMMRVRVVVTWAGVRCGTESCTYRLTALIDPSNDALWNTNPAPVAYDDSFTVDAGDASTGATPTYFDLLGNDTVTYTASGTPLEGVSQPPHGEATAGTGDYRAGVFYVPSAKSYSGSDIFTYRARDAQGRGSNKANVNVRILPNPQPDSGSSVALSKSTTIDVMANDYGTDVISGGSKKIVPVWDDSLDVFSNDPDGLLTSSRSVDQANLAKFSIKAVGGKISVSAPADAAIGTTITFYYYLVDVDPTSGTTQEFHSTKPAKVTVLIGSCMNVADFVVDIPATVSGTSWNDLGINALNGNDASCRVQITAVGYPYGQKGEIQVGTNNYNAANNNTASKISFKPQDNSPYIFTITYKVWTADGAYSSGQTKTITVRVIPQAVSDSFTFNVGGSGEVNLRNNDAPNDNTVKVVIVDPLTTGCGSFVSAQWDNGKSNYSAPTTARSCTFTYKLVATSYPGIESKVVTVTIDVGLTDIHSKIRTADVWSNYPTTPNINGEDVTKVYDKTASTKWLVGLNALHGSLPIQLVYPLTTAQTLTKYSITSANDNPDRDPTSWRIYGSNTASARTDPTDSSWQMIDSESSVTFATRGLVKQYTVNNPGSYRYYRLEVRSLNGSTDLFQIADWTLVS